jgi:SAM-dependent methyltransferase
MATHISTRQTQFHYFDQLLDGPGWKGSKILDFGGNVGGFLASANGRVNHNDYWCLDVTKAAIEKGRSKFPRAHFVFYNRYSSYFNPDGVRNLPVPDLGLKFDIIMAFSVFTHTHRNEMLELMEQLRSMLATQGVLAFTFYDPGYDRSLTDPLVPSGSGVIEMFEQRQPVSQSREIEGRFERAHNPGWGVEVDGEIYVEPDKELNQQERRGKPGESYFSFFTADYMASLFPDATILPPVRPEWQHCCILKH